MINIREYELLSLETGAFKDIELEILKETLNAWKERPGNPYNLIELRDGRILAGFCLYYRSPHTDHTYDLHTFIVGRDYRGSAVGPRLLELLEERVREDAPYSVIRIETSRIKEHTIAETFYSDQGFQTIGHIPGFYEDENDYFIYVKAVQPLVVKSPGAAVSEPSGKESLESAPDPVQDPERVSPDTLVSGT